MTYFAPCFNSLFFPYIGLPHGRQRALASDWKLRSQLRELWKNCLEAQDLGEAGLLDVVQGQPLLRLLRTVLEAAGDSDRDFLRQAEKGRPVES